MRASRFQRGPRPGLRKKWTPSEKTPRAFMLFRVFGLTRSIAAASELVRYSPITAPDLLIGARIQENCASACLLLANSIRKLLVTITGVRGDCQIPVFDK